MPEPRAFWFGMVQFLRTAFGLPIVQWKSLVTICPVSSVLIWGEPLWVFACAKWGPVLRAPLEYRGFSIGTEWPVEKFGSSEIHRCTVGFPQTIS
jgi:hypothetical protein